MQSLEVFVFAIAILIWLISALVKGLKWLGRNLGGTSARPGLVEQAAADAQRQAAARPPGPVAPAALSPVRPPAFPVPAPVRYKTSAAVFVSQEEALRAEEVSGLGVPLVSTPAPRAPQAAPLFGGTDDLVRAIILQEVLGPPLSRRAAAPPPVPPPA